MGGDFNGVLDVQKDKKGGLAKHIAMRRKPSMKYAKILTLSMLGEF